MIFKWMNESEINIEGDKIEMNRTTQNRLFCGSIDEC